MGCLWKKNSQKKSFELTWVNFVRLVNNLKIIFVWPFDDLSESMNYVILFCNYVTNFWLKYRNSVRWSKMILIACLPRNYVTFYQRRRWSFWLLSGRNEPLEVQRYVIRNLRWKWSSQLLHKKNPGKNIQLNKFCRSQSRPTNQESLSHLGNKVTAGTLTC